MDKLIDLQDHSKLIGQILAELGYVSSSDWFNIAAKVNGIKYDSFKYDHALLGYCESADDYTEAEGIFREELIQELIIFNFIWNGLESFVSDLGLKKCPFNRGKINSVTHYIQSEFDTNAPLFKYYSETIITLRSLLKNTEILSEGEVDLNKLFCISQCNSTHGIGLSVVYKIRNEFAHGAFRFRIPNDWNRDPQTGLMTIEPLNDSSVFSISSRIVLMSIQIILLGHLKSDESQINLADYDHLQDEVFLKRTDYLRLLHFYDFDTFDTDQLTIDFQL